MHKCKNVPKYLKKMSTNVKKRGQKIKKTHNTLNKEVDNNLSNLLPNA